MKNLTIFIIAGEASGDILGAGLMRALKEKQPDIKFTGIGGDLMIREGFYSLFNMNELSLMGIIEPLKHLPRLFYIRKKLLQWIKENKPDVVIGIDSPDFNLGLELLCKKMGIKTVHYVSPSVWAWRKWRIYKIKKAVDLMLVLFPFETEIYKQHNIPVKFIGHPLADQLPLEPDIKSAREKLNLPLDKKILAILPGSRNNELYYLAELFLKVAKICQEKIATSQKLEAKSNQFVTALGGSKQESLVCSVGTEQCSIPTGLQKTENLILISAVIKPEHELLLNNLAKKLNLTLQIFKNQSHEVMQASDAILLASGTAALEAMLLKTPMTIAYRMHPINYWLAKKLINIPYFSLPNLITNKKLIPEFLQEEANIKNLSESVLSQLQNINLSVLKQEYETLHHLLRHNASEQAANAILEMIL